MGEIDDDPPTELETLREAMAEERLWIAADENDVPVAFVYARHVDDSLYIQEFDVARAHQRRGIGARLIEAVCAAATARNFGAVTLSTFADVPWNAPYYARLGFSIVPNEALSSGMRAIEEEETAFGLDVSRRVFMRHDL